MKFIFEFLYLPFCFLYQKYILGKSKDFSIVQNNYESLSIPVAFNSWKNTENADLTHCSQIK